MKETDIYAFWDRHPCGDTLVGGSNQYLGDYEKFFSEYDSYRYRTEGHILRCLQMVASQAQFAGHRCCRSA